MKRLLCSTRITALLLILSVCLHGNPLKDYRELFYWLNELNDTNFNASVQLYTPELQVQELGRMDALKCFREGLKVLENECREDEMRGYCGDIIINIEGWLKEEMRKPSNSSDCNAYPKKSLKIFREKLQEMFQWVNSQNSGPRT